MFNIQSNRCAAIEINVLLGKNLDRHVVDGINRTLHDDGIEERIDTGITLLISMLGNEERDAAITNAFLVLGHHIVAHNLHVAAIAAIKEIAHDVSLRVKCYTMMYVRVCREELLEYAVVILMIFVERQIDFGNLNLWEMVYHVMAETSLTVSLLL